MGKKYLFYLMGHGKPITITDENEERPLEQVTKQVADELTESTYTRFITRNDGIVVRSKDVVGVCVTELNPGRVRKAPVFKKDEDEESVSDFLGNGNPSTDDSSLEEFNEVEFENEVPVNVEADEDEDEIYKAIQEVEQELEEQPKEPPKFKKTNRPNQPKPVKNLLKKTSQRHSGKAPPKPGEVRRVVRQPEQPQDTGFEEGNFDQQIAQGQSQGFQQHDVQESQQITNSGIGMGSIPQGARTIAPLIQTHRPNIPDRPNSRHKHPYKVD